MVTGSCQENETKLIMVSIVLVLSGITPAQMKPDHTDPTEVSPDKYKVLLENEHVRVLEYRIEPGEKDAWHTHPPKVSYIVSGGKLRVTTEGGDSFMVEEGAGDAAWMGAVGPHFAENVGATPIRIALIEIRSLPDAPFKDLGEQD